MKYIGLKEVRERVDNLDESVKLEYSQTIAVGLAIRYGIYGTGAQELRSLKLEYINKEKRTIDLYTLDNKYLRTIQVDDYLINWLQLAATTQTHNSLKLGNTGYVFRSSTKRKSYTTNSIVSIGTINGRVRKFLDMINFEDCKVLDWFGLRELDYAECLRRKNGNCTSKDYIKIIYTLQGKISKSEALELKTAHLNFIKGKDFPHIIIGRRKSERLTNTYINEIINALDNLNITG